MKAEFHEDRLIAALNKYWRGLSEDEYYRKMDIPATNNAISVAQFPKEVEDWIWIKERKPFEVF